MATPEEVVSMATALPRGRTNAQIEYKSGAANNALWRAHEMMAGSGCVPETLKGRTLPDGTFIVQIECEPGTNNSTPDIDGMNLIDTEGPKHVEE